MLKSGGVCIVTHPHFRTVRDMHVRTDHINRHASVSGSYEDSTGAISNGAAQFSVISPICVRKGGVCSWGVEVEGTGGRKTKRLED